jgi:hypothetical protein
MKSNSVPSTAPKSDDIQEAEIDLSLERVRKWIEMYELKMGEAFTYDPEKEKCIWHPDHGIATWSIDKKNNAIIANKVVGDGKYWENILIDIARFFGCTRLMAYTTRNPKAWKRAYGMDVIGYMIAKEIGR